MVLGISNSLSGRAGIPTGETSKATIVARAAGDRPRGRPVQRLSRALESTLSWMIQGYQQANAGDLAASVAFNAMVALIPTFLLFFSVAGLFLHIDQVRVTTIYASFWGLPAGTAGDAFDAVLTARRGSSWLGILSLIGFAWAGTGFVGCLARSMNRIYGVAGCGYMCEKRRGFFVIFAFAALFILAILTATVPTLFVRGDLPAYFESWALSAGRVQAISYLVAFWETIVLFGMLYRVVPNAGQRIADVWGGTLTAATLFMAMAQVFPIYLGFIGGANRFGALFGLVSLLIAWFFVLAHVLLFGAYINASMLRRQRRRALQQATREQAGKRPAKRPDHDAD